METRRRAWVLNLDADDELARPAGYSPRAAVLASMAPFVARVATALLREGDVLADESTPLGAWNGWSGRAFCPTPRALALLRRAGAVPEPAPALNVLRVVNSRAFSASLGPSLPASGFVTSFDELHRWMSTEPPSFANGWRLKRAFGMAGRGQRRIDPAAVTDADLAFARAALRDGGIQIEPNVRIVEEYALHGMRGADGSYVVGTVVRQQCDRHGAWVATVPLGDSDVANRLGVHAALHVEAARVVDAFASAGYFGPWGIDAYAYDAGDGTFALQTRSEVNARYSMGYAVGMNERALP